MTPFDEQIKAILAAKRDAEYEMRNNKDPELKDYYEKQISALRTAAETIKRVQSMATLFISN